MEYKDSTELIIEWLKDQPKNASVIWTSDHFSAETPYCFNWADINLPEFQKEVEDKIKYLWVFTIYSEGSDLDDVEEETRLDWEFIYPQDLTIACIWSPKISWFDNDIVLRPGEELTDVQRAELQTVANAEEGAFVTTHPAWSIAAINCALGEWAETYTGRTDLVFEWNPDGEMSEMMQEAIQAMEDVKSGKAQLHTIDLDELFSTEEDDV